MLKYEDTRKRDQNQRRRDAGLGTIVEHVLRVLPAVRNEAEPVVTDEGLEYAVGGARLGLLRGAGWRR